VPENAPNSLGESTFTLLNPKNERKTQLGSFFCDRFYGAVSVRKVFQRSRPKSTSPHSKRVVGVSAEKKSRTPFSQWGASQSVSVGRGAPKGSQVGKSVG
jgi:hypothetical protein